jgi:CRISPR/Cas system CSM-associated protein Csm2 small subunit
MSAHEIDILRKFGIKVPKTQVGDFIAMINNDPELSKEMEKIEASLGTMRNEDLFI